MHKHIMREKKKTWMTTQIEILFWKRINGGLGILLTRHVPYPMIGILIPLNKVKNFLLAIFQVFFFQ